MGNEKPCEVLHTEPDVIQGCPSAEQVDKGEPTVHAENVDLLAEVQQLKSAVGVLVQAVPLTAADMRIIERGGIRESIL